MAMTAGYTDHPVPASPFDRLSLSVEGICEQAKRIEALSERLCGPQPPAMAEAKGIVGVVGNGGIFEGVTQQTKLLEDLASRIGHAISRIQDRL